MTKNKNENVILRRIKQQKKYQILAENDQSKEMLFFPMLPN